jgi:hypothetical protein
MLSGQFLELASRISAEHDVLSALAEVESKLDNLTPALYEASASGVSVAPNASVNVVSLGAPRQLPKGHYLLIGQFGMTQNAAYVSAGFNATTFNAYLEGDAGATGYPFRCSFSKIAYFNGNWDVSIMAFHNGSAAITDAGAIIYALRLSESQIGDVTLRSERFSSLTPYVSAPSGKVPRVGEIFPPGTFFENQR